MWFTLFKKVTRVKYNTIAIDISDTFKKAKHNMVLLKGLGDFSKFKNAQIFLQKQANKSNWISNEAKGKTRKHFISTLWVPQEFNCSTILNSNEHYSTFETRLFSKSPEERRRAERVQNSNSTNNEKVERSPLLALKSRPRPDLKIDIDKVFKNIWYNYNR